MKLFCFPYAGGSASVFSKWKPLLPNRIELRAVELAGRGRRIHENFYESFEQLQEDLFQLIEKEILLDDYIFFGHSLGAKIIYELAVKIVNSGLPLPKHLFFSGRGAPYVLGNDDEDFYNLPDKEFREVVFKLGGTPREFFESVELLELFMPLLRSDFKLAERKVENKSVVSLPCDITIFLGKDENITPEQADGWKQYTKGVCTIQYFQGGHFFINEQFRVVVKKILSTIGY